MEESALIQRALQRDEQAWEALVHEHQQAVFRLAYLFTGDPDEAEDVTQETFIRAIHNIQKFDPARSFRPWVLSIAANLARNRLRGFKRYQAALQSLFSRDPDPVQAHASKQTSAEEGQELWQTVRKLSQDDQQVIYLRFFLDLSEAETSAVLEVPPGTVKSRLHRALERLRARLGQGDDDRFKAVDRD
jgi:RNA polymerase sigma-70 factor (ECF subfamily)